VIAALFVEKNGCYSGLPNVDLWDIERDARKYEGPSAVVAHPPCFLWVNLAAVNWKRYQRQLPAWYPGGGDDGCFKSALTSARRFGGVLEHPANSHAWSEFGLEHPKRVGGWSRSPRLLGWTEWVCEVWQSAYGHPARKRTWLLYVSSRWNNDPPDLDWSRQPGTHQVGWFDRNKPTLSKKQAIATPHAFRDALIGLAEHSQHRRAA
jgi:hypothetical protein